MEVRDQSFQINHVNYGQFIVNLDDIVYRYQDPTYNHLRWHYRGEGADVTDGVFIRALFLGEKALDLLAESGVPETYVDMPTTSIAVAYEGDLINTLESQFE